jgi:acyl-CoA thioesterase-1
MTPIISRTAPVLSILAALFFVPACGGPAPPGPRPSPIEPAATPTEASIRIVVLGDSIAAGLGLPEEDAFPAVLEDMLTDSGYSVSVVNAGVSGDTSAGGLRRIDWILEQEPDLLVVELGGNDALRGQPLANTRQNLRRIIRRAKDGGARVILAGMDVPPSYGPDYAGSFAKLYEEVAREEGIILVPGFVREVGLNRRLMQPDGIHPTAEGQRMLAEKLLPYLEEAVAEIDKH